MLLKGVLDHFEMYVRPLDNHRKILALKCKRIEAEKLQRFPLPFSRSQCIASICAGWLSSSRDLTPSSDLHTHLCAHTHHTLTQMHIAF